ncbi:MAG: fused MFS/spermidine synthase [Polyangiales bacterium]
MTARFSAASLVAALLLFVIQPMVARALLPRVGGAAAVWTASQLFFQCALLLGYGLAHWLPARLGTRRHARLHVALCALCALTLPPDLQGGSPPPVSGDPTAWLVLTLLRALGLPLVLLAMSAPLLQRWLATRGENPYPLYAASNLGSLTALALYPFAIEPLLSLRAQRWAWSVGWLALCGLLLRAARVVEEDPPREPADDAPTPARAWGMWVLLSFAPALLSLGATVAITTDIAPVPLLWTAPLALYLLSYIVAFRPDPPDPVKFAAPFLGLLVVVFLTAAARVSPGPMVSVLHLAQLFLGALMLHTELARRRPPPSQLGRFYLAVALGGALAGLFASVIAPLIFRRVTEYPLAMALVVALLPTRPGARASTETRVRDVGVALLVGVVAWRLFTAERFGARENLLRYGAPLALLLVASMGRRPRIAMGLVAILAASSLDRSTLFEARSFYGVMRVDDDGRARRFLHGTTLHGLVWNDPKRRREATAYYDPQSPIGQVMAALPGDRARVGVVGLGVGMLAAWRRGAQRWTFFELDGAVADIARRWFPWLEGCGGACDVVLGDARRTVGDDRRGGFDLLVLDAFSSDAIPTHLLTREAFGVWRGHLAPGGVIAVHITNRYVDLTGVLGALARDEGLAARLQRRTLVDGDTRIVTTWVVLAREPSHLGSVGADPRWGPLPRGGRAWTDERTDLLRTLRRP